MISVGDDAGWAALRRAMGDPAWAADERFADAAGRRAHHDELDAGIVGVDGRPRPVGASSGAARPTASPPGRCSTTPTCSPTPTCAARGFFRPNGSPEVGRHATPATCGAGAGRRCAGGAVPLRRRQRAGLARRGRPDAEEYAALDAGGHLSLDYFEPDGTPL